MVNIQKMNFMLLTGRKVGFGNLATVAFKNVLNRNLQKFAEVLRNNLHN